MSSSIPLLALDVKPPQPLPNPLEQYGQVMQLKNLMQQGQLQQSQLAGEQQRQQQSAQLFTPQLQQQQAASKQAQLDLQDRQGLNQALKDTYGGSAAGTEAPAGQPQQPPWTPMQSYVDKLRGGTGIAPVSDMAQPASSSASPSTTPPSSSSNAADRLTDFLNRIQDPKYGISATGQIGMLEKFNAMRDQFAKTDTDTINAHLAANKSISQGLNSVLQAPSEDQAAQYTIERNALMRDPTMAKYAQALPPQYPGTPAPGGSPELQRAQHGLMAEEDLVKVTQEGAELPGQIAKSTQATQEAAAPTQQQIADATRTIGTYSGISPAERQGLIAEASHAPDFATLKGVQARADSAQSTGEMKQATLAQAKAMAGNKFGEAGLTANEKIWTDPSKGFAGALAQANQTRASIKAGADGNALLTNMVPTMEVLGINHAAGINRISPQEAISARVSPDWATRWNAWATSAATGKLTPQLAQQGQQLMDIVTDAAYQKSVQSSQFIAKGHSLDPSQVPAMNRDGSLTTLDQVGKGGGSSRTSTQNLPAVAAGMTRIRASDGTLHDIPTQNLARARQIDPNLQVSQ